MGHGGTGSVPSAVSVVVGCFEGTGRGQGGTGSVPSDRRAGFGWLDDCNVAEHTARDMYTNTVRQQSFRNIMVPPFLSDIHQGPESSIETQKLTETEIVEGSARLTEEK